MNLRRFLWICVAVLILSLGIWAWFSSGKSPWLTLSDGRRVRIAAVTYGTTHQHVEGGVAARWFSRILPPRFHRRLGWFTIRHTTQVPALMIWVHSDSGPASKPHAAFLSVIDSAGNQSEPRHSPGFAFPRPGEIVIGCELTDFPRREKTFRVRLYDRDNSYRPHLAAELPINNPALNLTSSPFGSLPRVAVTNSTKLILENLVTGEPIPEKLKVARGFFNPWSTAVFRVENRPNTDHEWQVEQLEIRDPTGNHFVPRPTTFCRVGDFLLFGFSKPWWASENSYAFTAGFSRTKGFATNELLTFRIPKVPQPGATLTLADRVMIGDLAISLSQLRRYSRAARGPFREPLWNSETAFRILPPAPGISLSIIEARADGTNLVPVQARSTFPDARYFSLALPPEAEALDLVVAVQPLLEITFDPVPRPKRLP